ncbi:hypothetical protein EVG20_g5483 [Dentipellis fragilis]|uniref:Uncharacterized protein n=1 Tax=Dentipellis fragilis TaxID=205917 RepID=A0A4Y9YV48_9AGAM|nr:hypothetical protein EVG20_g5483 [Dentipellis fragilis]
MIPALTALVVTAGKLMLMRPDHTFILSSHMSIAPLRARAECPRPLGTVRVQMRQVERRVRSSGPLISPRELGGRCLGSATAIQNCMGQTMIHTVVDMTAMLPLNRGRAQRAGPSGEVEGIGNRPSDTDVARTRHNLVRSNELGATTSNVAMLLPLH